MAVQQIKAKFIKKFDVADPNFKPLPKPEPEEVTGNILETDVYGEETQHFYQPDNGNLQITELMTGLINKLDGWSGHRKSSGLAYLYKTELVINDIYEINALNDIIRTPYLLSINWSGQDIYIINNHFKASGGSINEQQRKTASKKI